MLGSEEETRVEDEGVFEGDALLVLPNVPKTGFEVAAGCEAAGSAGLLAVLEKDAKVRGGFSAGFSGAF